MVITVDLEAQVLSIFRGGYEIGAAAILYGRDDKPTPLGAFPITQKQRPPRLQPLRRADALHDADDQ